MKKRDVAIICHEANRNLCEIQGYFSQKAWGAAADWQKESAEKGVEYAIANPDGPADAQHNAWMADKVKDGWVYGEVKDPEKKTHPCIVPFEQLPPMQQAKDHLFKAIVNSLAPFITE